MNNFNVPAFTVCGATVNLAATGSSSNVQVRTAPTSRHIRIWNSGTVAVFVEFGADNTVAATTAASMPIAPGNTEVLSCAYEYVAAITGSGTATIYITPGEGI